MDFENTSLSPDEPEMTAEETTEYLEKAFTEQPAQPPAAETPQIQEAPVSKPDEDALSAIEELKNLASLEAEQYDYLPKPPRRLRSQKDHLFARVFFSMLVVFVVLFVFTARRVFGKGWIKTMLTGRSEGAHFTLPIAEIPELEDRFYQPDGRFTVEGVNNAVSPSIVTIEAYAEDSAFTAYGQGSGIIMSEDGYIITNAHVIEKANLSIKVRLKDGSEYSAKLIGSDPKSDLAVIKIAADGLPAAQFGDSDKVILGEQVVAIGSPAGLEGSVTTGIVSGVDRMIRVKSTSISTSCIQIDAAINPGNSGGALINMWGQVIGITSSKLDSLEFDNIGFAIEMSAAKPIIEQLIENGHVLGRPKVGISFYEISKFNGEMRGTPAGLEIAEISEDCDIANTELEIGDYITEMNGVEVYTADDVYGVILKLKPGDKVTAKIVRIIGENEDTGEPELNEFEIEFKLMEDTSFIEESEEE